MRVLSLLVRGCALVSVVACAACDLPKSAPVAVNVEEAPDPINSDFFVVPLVPPVVQVMGNRKEAGFPAAFHLGGYTPSIALKPGDVISVTIYEVGGSPTFGSLPSRSNFAQQNRGQTGQSAQSQTALQMSPMPSGGTFDLTGFPRRSTALSDPGRPIDKVLVASNAPMPFMMAQTTTTPTPTAPAPVPTAPPPPSNPIGTPTSRTLPPLTIENDGDVLIPYADRVHVAGLTPTQAAERIRDALTEKALNPQVLVSFVSNGSNQTTVGGEANRPGPIPLSLRGERLLDVIGAAGGSRWPAPDTDIDIIRGRHGARVKLQTVVESPSENIKIRPNDEIFLTHDPRSFTVLGASQKVAQYTFDVPRVTLAEAVGRAGGAIDTVGNPAAIYLLREEPSPIADRVLQIAASLKLPDEFQRLAPIDSRRVKLVYKLNMNSAEGYFLSRQIVMLDKDVVLIANAEGTQLLKLFTLARGVTGAISDLNLIPTRTMISR